MFSLHFGNSEERNKALFAVAAVGVASSALTAAVMYFLQRSALSKLERPKASTIIYESDESARQYMEFHYTPTRTSFTQRLRMISEAFDYPVRVAAKFKEFSPETSTEFKQALDIGCATGASVLEMSKYFSTVTGVDYSETFIHLAQELIKDDGSHRGPVVAYTAPEQGERTVERVARVPFGSFPKRCKFYCGDAMELMAADGKTRRHLSGRYNNVSLFQVPPGEQFDAVLAANLLCRLPDPRRLIETFPRLVRSGGVLVISSPYSWWEGATPKGKWIGGKEGEPRSEEAVKELLNKDFDLLSETDEAFLIRDHVRRYQLGFAHCTVWRRR